MKNLVYLVVSSAVVLGILIIVINLYKNDENIIHGVTTQTDIMKNVNADGMIEQANYTGADIISIIRYEEIEHRVIEIEFVGTEIAVINDNVNRGNEIDAAITIISSEGSYVNISGTAVSYLNQPTYSTYVNTGDNEQYVISYRDAKYDLVEKTDTKYKFKLKP